MRLSPAQLDRAVGAVVGMAVGNALGVGYAFSPSIRPEAVELRAGGLGPYGVGEWGDDTAMAMPILMALQEGASLLDRETEDAVAAQWVRWAQAGKDVPPAVAAVLAAHDPARGAESLHQFAQTQAHVPPGNASLMRTTPVALGYLQEPDDLVRASRRYSDLTHSSPLAGDACVLWNLAQRHAILHGEFDLAGGLDALAADRQAGWERLITQAEVGSPADFALHNGRVPQLLQTAWSAITTCMTPGPQHFEDALRAVVAAGGDTPTAATVTGGLLGACWGVSAIPLEWRRRVYGWPGYRDRELVWAARAAVGEAGRPSRCLPRAMVRHPDDEGLLLGPVGASEESISAVMSLCELGTEEEPAGVARVDQVDVWMQSSADPADNPHLGHVVE